MSNEMKQVSVPITNSVWRKLLEIKKRTGNSLVSIIRIAIDEYLKDVDSKDATEHF